MSDDLSLYIPMDRRQALARRASLPTRASGAALLADIAGFTPLTEALAGELGPQRGAEELTVHLNRVYEALIALVHAYGGSVIGFSGDAITCWFDQRSPIARTRRARGGPVSRSTNIAARFAPSPSGRRSAAARRALACALAMQQAIGQAAQITTGAGIIIKLAVKVAVACGSVQRFVVGDPQLQLIDVLAGRTVELLAAAERSAGRGEVVLDGVTARLLGSRLLLDSWRDGQAPAQQVAVVAGLARAAAPAPWPDSLAARLPDELTRPWLHPAVYRRLQHHPDAFLAELRPAVALMLQVRLRGPEQHAAEQLDRLVCAALGLAERYEAALIDVTQGDQGSQLYLAFGAPTAHDDDAGRAVAAAQALLSLVATLPYSGGARVGVARGRVRAGAYGGAEHRAYGVLGDATNLATRLMSAAPWGAVWCDAAVYQSAQRLWAFEPLPAIRVKGKASAVRVYRPLGEQSRRDAAPAPARLIGRQHEINLVSRRLDELAQAEGQVLIVDGEAGIGKSRLIAELVGMARERGLVGLIGGGHSIEQQTPYRAWRDIFNAYFGLDGVDAPPARRARVEEQLADLLPGHREQWPVLNDLLNLGLPESSLTRSLDAALRSEMLSSLLVGLLAAWTSEQPLILVLEDAHWFDSRSWDLTVRAARVLIGAGRPLLLVLTLRPLHADHPATRSVVELLRLRGATRHTLGALSIDDTLALAAKRLGVAAEELPAPAVELVRGRAGGNPLFAEELAASLRDHGLDNAGAATVDRLIPDTLQGLLLARFDRLTPEQQLTLKVAAVVGPVFDYSPLRYVRNRQNPTDDTALRDQLRSLASHDFTALETPDPNLSYRFRHILTQEAAYQTLLYAQRRALHRGVAEWYEHTFGEQAPGQPAALAPYLPLLAHHYRHAEETDRERRYAELAGIQAADQFANDEAAAFFSRALELTPAAAAEARFRLVLAREKVYDYQGARLAQQAELATLAALADELGDPLRQAQVALRQASYAEATSDFRGASKAARRAAALARAAGAADVQAAGFVRWGWARMWLSDYPAARARLQRALAIARAANLPEREADSLLNLGVVAEHQGDYTAARAHQEDALRLYRETGNRHGESLALNNLGAVAGYQGDLPLARGYFEQALRCYEAIGDRRGETRVLGNLGLVATLEHDAEGARRYLERALAGYITLGERRGESITLVGLAALADELGDYGRAGDYCRQALCRAREIGFVLQESHALSLAARLALRANDFGAAESLSRQALAIACEINALPRQARALTRLGHALSGQNRFEEAVAAFEQAIKLWRSLGQPADALEPIAGLAAAALARGDAPGALTHAEAILAVGWPNDGEELLWIRLVCYRALRASNDPRAQPLLAAAEQQLRERAARIADVGLRRSFLAIAAHQAIVAAAAESPGGLRPAGVCGPLAPS